MLHMDTLVKHILLSFSFSFFLSSTQISQIFLQLYFIVSLVLEKFLEGIIISFLSFL